jgi:hypothetical protein
MKAERINRDELKPYRPENAERDLRMGISSKDDLAIFHALDRLCGGRCRWLADYKDLAWRTGVSLDELRSAMDWLAINCYFTVTKMPALGNLHSGFGTVDVITLHDRPDLDRPVEDWPLSGDAANEAWLAREQLRYKTEAKKLIRRSKRRPCPGQGSFDFMDPDQ